MNNDTTWRKSSRSNDTGTCVELNNTLTRVRDSKNPGGPTLRVPRGFVQAVKNGKLG
jgi:hypothetical protein